MDCGFTNSCSYITIEQGISSEEAIIRYSDISTQCVWHICSVHSQGEVGHGKTQHRAEGNATQKIRCLVSHILSS